jgi:hypothetical protein
MFSGNLQIRLLLSFFFKSLFIFPKVDLLKFFCAALNLVFLKLILPYYAHTYQNPMKLSKVYFNTFII